MRNSLYGKNLESSYNSYIWTKKFPKEETYSLIDQIRRSSISIPSNIAEGSGIGGNTEYKRLLSIAKGSACELETQIVLAHDLGYIKEKDYLLLEEHIDTILRLLSGLIKNLPS